MLTIQKLKTMNPCTIFLKGEIIDSPDGINISNSGKQLRWVANRGGTYDWAIFYHFADKDWDWIRSFGDKIMIEKNIRKLVKCDDEAFKMYNY